MERAVLKPRIILTLCALGLWCASAHGQRLWGRSAGSVGSGGLTSTSLYCASEGVNPSGPAYVGRLTVTASVVVPYGLAELAETSGAAILPAKLCVVTVKVGASGNEWSRFTTFGADVSRRFGRVAIGIGYRGLTHKLRFSESGRSSMTICGASFRPDERWEIGVAARNIEGRRLKRGGEETRLGRTLWASAKWRAPRVFGIGAEMEKESGKDAAAHVGVWLEPGGGLRFTAGFSTSGAEIGAGAGYERETWGVRAGVAHHQHLGVSGGAAITFHPDWP